MSNWYKARGKGTCNHSWKARDQGQYDNPDELEHIHKCICGAGHKGFHKCNCGKHSTVVSKLNLGGRSNLKCLD